MSQEELILRIAELEKQNEQLKNELEETKAHLKKYTAPASSKKYYQEHKEEHKQRVREYQKRTNYKSESKHIPSTEQRKEYNRRAYLKKKEKEKEKLDKETQESQENI